MCMEFVKHADGVILGQRKMQLSHMIFFPCCVLSLCLPPFLFHSQQCNLHDMEVYTKYPLKNSRIYLLPLKNAQGGIQYSIIQYSDRTANIAEHAEMLVFPTRPDTPLCLQHEQKKGPKAYLLGLLLHTLMCVSYTIPS